MRFINLTHLPVQREGVTIPPSGGIAEFDEISIWQGTINGLDKYKVVGGVVIGIPPAKEGVTYIVSHAVKNKLLERNDVFSISFFWESQF